ncbi:thioredoxin family protein [Alkaliphilus hydrothermalis]|uniref:Thioredoxin n=1 Tax=Alkaliphilus hydrothermalis TaxID=1482730 RepID=A0ABS2NQZ3_9FIRM|nr:thioredoxin family protein [Alkaliphilus hydrothermalis]MBM7615358.1 hypothetical protein [Alkaliphilus hydrothermalis]
MTYGELLALGCTFEEFIDQDKDLNREKTLEIYRGIEIDDELINRIKEVDRPIKVLAFAEIWCPDCIINVPALQIIKDVNALVDLRILPRDGNEEYLADYKVAGKVKIPTFIVLDENEEKLGVFIETPKVLKEVVVKGNQVEIIVAKRKYRKGEYVVDTIKEMVSMMIRK